MDPARMFKESLTSCPELENSQGQKRKCARSRGMSVRPSGADIVRLHVQVRFVPLAIFCTAVYSTLFDLRSTMAPRSLSASNRRGIVRFGDQHYLGGHRSWT